MALSEKKAGVEWVGGLVSVPAYVCDDAAPYRPDALFWMDEHGAMLRSRLEKPGRLLTEVAESLRALIAEVELEHGPAPACVRVASRELAERLAAAFPALEIVSAPTPEIDALVQQIRAQFDCDAARAEAYLAGGHEPAPMAAFFAAAAALFRAAPWRSIPSEQHLLSVTIEALGLRNAVLSVIGQQGRSVGWLLFANRGEFERYLDATDALAHGQLPAMPSHFALHFERGAALSPGARKEVARYAWPVASADAYPWLAVMDEDLIARPPTAKEIAVAEALTRALPALLAESRAALLSAWHGGAQLARTLRVASHGGDVSVRMRTLASMPDASAQHTAQVKLADQHRRDFERRAFQLAQDDQPAE